MKNKKREGIIKKTFKKVHWNIAMIFRKGRYTHEEKFIQKTTWSSRTRSDDGSPDTSNGSRSDNITRGYCAGDSTRTAGRSNRTADGRSGDSGSDCRVITWGKWNSGAGRGNSRNKGICRSRNVGISETGRISIGRDSADRRNRSRISIGRGSIDRRINRNRSRIKREWKCNWWICACSKSNRWLASG